MKQSIHLFLLLLFSNGINAQVSLPFQISIEKSSVEHLPALQSYAWAKTGTKILLVGGRTDGLHKRQPFASFNKKFNNTDLIVWDYHTNQIWTRSILDLPGSIVEQLQSSNMEFYQHENILWLLGGYGFSVTKNNHITHPYVTGIRVEEMVTAIINKDSIQPFIKQTYDARLAVTGGRMHQMNNKYYLVGGQRFDGRYNPHGPDHGPGFTQEYSNEIRIFDLKWINHTIVLDNFRSVRDENLLHRRDYNLLPQIDEKGNNMLTLYSGVFRYDKDLPYTSLVDIKNNKPVELTGFSQKFAHYHTANLSLYSKKLKSQYSIFFGGMAQYYPSSNDSIVSDDNVPFVKTISVIKRNAKETIEIALPIKMDNYFGAASEFIPVNETLFSTFGILDIDKLDSGKKLAGVIIGGIFSNEPNVFWSNNDSNNGAAPYIWKIYISAKTK